MKKKKKNYKQTNGKSNELTFAVKGENKYLYISYGN